MRVVPFLPGHLQLIATPEVEEAMIGYVADFAAIGWSLFQPGYAFSGLADDGTLIGSAGVLPLHPGVGEAWAWIGPTARPGRASRLWLEIDGAVRTFLRDAMASKFHRVGTKVRADFPAGIRWAERLGFINEGPAWHWGSDGSNYVHFARLR